MNDHDRRVLEALAKAVEQREELAELLNFYHDLYTVQFEAKPDLPQPEIRDDLAVRWRLEGGIPQLTFDQIGFEAKQFQTLAKRIAEVVVRHNPTWELQAEDWTPERLMALAQEVYETWDTLTAPKPSSEPESEDESWAGYPAALAVGFTLAPYLQVAAESILPGLDLSLWKKGYCPVCGGRPNFSILAEETGSRQLMCSRCASLWNFARTGCPFCAGSERTVYHPSEDGEHRLYVCKDCNRYLKAVDLREVKRVVQPMVERLTTVGMDLAARQEGYEG